ncbi:MAG: hypothetical protein AABW89_05905 [Nanoarchaeota archaeon]
MNKKYLIPLSVIFLSFIGIIVIAQGSLIPPGLNQIFGPFPIVTCSESDGGLNIYQQGNNVINYNTTNLYDNFSSGQLSNNSWIESTWHNRPFTDEHFVNTTEQVYHIAQISVGDAETNLRPIRQFIAGESFSYEVTYRGGSGNHASQPLINGNYPPSQIEVCNYTTAGCGVIGYWNAAPDLGAQVGTYKIKFDFSQNQVRMTSIRPDNITIINTFTGNSAPYTLDINTHTGHNGLMHFDYDNFYISSIGTFSGLDFCLNNNELAEGLCGSWIDNNFGTNVFNTSFFIPTFYCNASNNATHQFSCVNGACV